MFKSRRWPLMIDPQNQANSFIKKLSNDTEFSKNGSVMAYKSSDTKLMKALERAI